jgi:hypothetical protein
VRYGFEWTPWLVLVGAVLVLPLVPGFALIAVLIVAFVALAALVALAGALIAAPFLLVRGVRRRLAERPESIQAPAPMASALAHPAGAINH